jgi:hypothetical protein
MFNSYEITRGYPLVIKRGNGTFPLNEGFRRKIKTIKGRFSIAMIDYRRVSLIARTYG